MDLKNRLKYVFFFLENTLFMKKKIKLACLSGIYKTIFLLQFTRAFDCVYVDTARNSNLILNQQVSS